MKTNKLLIRIWLTCLVVLFFQSGFSQEHKHSPWEILSGSGEEEIVCYKRVHRNYYFLFLGGFLALSTVFNSRYRIKKRANAQLNHLNDRILKQSLQLEEKNKDITDSIRYASRIQAAILPDPVLLKERFRDSFIQYQPRDIVSGDFYFLAEQDGYFFLAACDCTGHGVPGALMSVLATNALRQAVSQSHDPGRVLDLADDYIRLAIREGEASVNDSVDLSLLVVGPVSGKAWFSGAMNSLLIVRSTEFVPVGEMKMELGGRGLYELRADKYSCGQRPSGEHFSTLDFDLLEGDCLYLYSDGFADQFGGDRGKKLKQRNFREMILKHSALPMSEQHERYREYFLNWRGSLEQVDDVCLIGLRNSKDN